MVKTLTNKFVGTVQTITPPIKTAGIILEKDAFLSEKNPDTNAGSITSMKVASTPSDGKVGVILSFTGLKTITSNILRYPISINLNTNFITSSTKPLVINVYEYNKNDEWQENDVTWNNAPAKGNKIKTIRLTSAKRNHSLDIKDLFLERVNGLKNDIGFYLETETVDDDKQYSLESKESSNPPSIEIKYYDIPNGSIESTINAEMFVMGLVGKTIFKNNTNTYSKNMEISCTLEVVNDDPNIGRMRSYAFIL